MEEIEELDDLAHQMFRQFSRMEHALKGAGHHPRADGDAKADWVDFAADIDAAFRAALLDDPELAEAVAYLRNQPPKKQVIRDLRLEWDEVMPTAPTETGVLLLLVSRVRNNLFHGGKFNGRWIDPGRSRQLLPRCLTILDRARSLSNKVSAAYEH